MGVFEKFVRKKSVLIFRSWLSNAAGPSMINFNYRCIDLHDVGIPLTIQRGHSDRMQKSPKRVSKWLAGASRPRGQKSQKRVKNEFKIDFFETFELVFNSFLTFLPPRGREAPGTRFETLFGRALTCLNKEVRRFFLGDNSIWSYPSVSSLSDYSIWRS